MDRVLIGRYEELFQGQKIKVDAFLIQKMGLLHKHTFLKAKDFFLYAVPTSLSFDEGQILLSMSERERSLLEEIRDKPQQLRMRFKSPLFGKELGLFVKAFIKEIIDGPKGTFAMVNLRFSGVPEDFKEILIELFLLNDRLKKEFEEKKQIGLGIPNNLFGQLGIQTITHIIVPGQGKYRCLMKDLGIANCRLYASVRLHIEHIRESEGASLELNWKDIKIVIPIVAFGEVSSGPQGSVCELPLELGYSLALVDIVLPMVELVQNRSGGGSAKQASEGEQT